MVLLFVLETAFYVQTTFQPVKNSNRYQQVEEQNLKLHN